MRFELPFLFLSGVGILHAGVDDAADRLMKSPACIELNQSVAKSLGGGRLAEAEAVLSAAMASRDSGIQQSCEWLILHNMATVMGLSGRLTEAEALEERSLAILARSSSPDDPIRLRPLHDLWTVQFQQGEFGKARQTFEKMRFARLESPKTRALYYGAAALQWQADGRFAEAETAYLKALAAWDEAGGDGAAVEVAALRTSLGTLYTSQRRYREAKEVLDQALAAISSAKDAVPMDRINVLTAQAVLHAEQRMWLAAVEDLKEGISMADRYACMDPTRMKTILLNYGFVLAKAHRRAESRSIQARAAAIDDRLSNAVVDVRAFVNPPRLGKK